MLPLVAPDSEDARAIKENVAEARSRAGLPAEAPTAKAATAPHPGIRGTVRLSQKLRDKLSPGDTLFVYARAAEGPPMPLAILRRKAGELPLEFALNDAMAMSPGMNVSAFPRVVVTARVSRSGNAKPQPGDLQGASKPVANDAKGVVVEINEVVP
jgi:cytochrome c-type biogenesis protein CcmH